MPHGGVGPPLSKGRHKHFCTGKAWGEPRLPGESRTAPPGFRCEREHLEDVHTAGATQHRVPSRAIQKQLPALPGCDAASARGCLTAEPRTVVPITLCKAHKLPGNKLA